jgi:hypothetical protein
MLVINSIEKTRLSADSYSYSGTGVAWKARLVLFLGFALMAGGLAGSVVSGSLRTMAAQSRKMLIHMSVGCSGSQIYRTRLPVSDPLLWSCKRHCKWFDHAKVCTCLLLGQLTSLTASSSVVLWVSQNMEDDYTYNLAL